MPRSPSTSPDLLEEGTLKFSIEGRILREIGERLVKKPEVALLELVKNAYDADATICEIVSDPPARITVKDNGQGMTFKEFKNGWMRIGTGAKQGTDTSREFERTITGEKGIGRFAVRFLGRSLHLETVAQDPARRGKTRLVADFDWPKFDREEDLGQVDVPFRLERVAEDVPLGTRLEIEKLRKNALNVDLYAVRTAAIGVVTPYHALLPKGSRKPNQSHSAEKDPGFALNIGSAENDAQSDVSRAVLDNYVIRAVLILRDERLRLSVYRKGETVPALEISDRYANQIGPVYADIRYFPKRQGTFSGLPMDGRLAATWIRKHSGVAVFDRTFRVHPYGMEADDWLSLSADAAKRAREPRSSISKKHFPMDELTARSTQLNYMLRLPYPQQLVGVVQVTGRRIKQSSEDDDTGLIASADREGFLNNEAFLSLVDVIRGAVEAIASVDRELQLDLEKKQQAAALKKVRSEIRSAVQEIEGNPAIPRGEKTRIIKRLLDTQELAEQHEERSRSREEALEVMSLLGVVAGYMTHEFGSAFSELEKAHERLSKLARKDASFKDIAELIAESIARLREFVTYSQGYIRGAATRPNKPYPARSRLVRTARVFGKYASDRHIDVEVQVEAEVMAPMVPVSLYDGIALNLFTNALKAVTARGGNDERRIALRAWNEGERHFLEVSDTGVGIPTTLRKRVFEPLFTTTSNNRDPLGSGMGLGLSLVRRGAETFGGRVDVVDAPAGFTTCVRVQIPLGEGPE